MTRRKKTNHNINIIYRKNNNTIIESDNDLTNNNSSDDDHFPNSDNNDNKCLVKSSSINSSSDTTDDSNSRNSIDNINDAVMDDDVNTTVVRLPVHNDAGDNNEIKNETNNYNNDMMIEQKVLNLCKKYRPITGNWTKYLWSITYEKPINWINKLSRIDNPPVFVIILHNDNELSKNDNNDSEHVNINKIQNVCQQLNIFHVMLSRTQIWNDFLADNTLALCFNQVKECDEFIISEIITESLLITTTSSQEHEESIMITTTPKINENNGSHQLNHDDRRQQQIATSTRSHDILEEQLYELFQRNIDTLWCITHDGKPVTCHNNHQDKLDDNDWQLQLDSKGSMITIILGTFNDSVNILIDDIIKQCHYWKKVYIIIHPTQLWMNRMKSIYPYNNKSIQLPIAICLPRIKLHDGNVKDILKEQVYQILLYNAGDIIGNDENDKVNGMIEKYISTTSSRTYLKLETEFEKIIDIIEDDRAGLLLFQKRDMISLLDPKYSTRNIISRCYQKDIPYIWISNLESIAKAAHVVLSEKLMFICLLKPRPLSDDDDLLLLEHQLNEQLFQNILNDVVQCQNEAALIQKGRHTKWPALENLIDNNPVVLMEQSSSLFVVEPNDTSLHIDHPNEKNNNIKNQSSQLISKRIESSTSRDIQIQKDIPLVEVLKHMRSYDKGVHQSDRIITSNNNKRPHDNNNSDGSISSHHYEKRARITKDQTINSHDDVFAENIEGDNFFDTIQTEAPVTSGITLSTIDQLTSKAFTSEEKDINEYSSNEVEEEDLETLKMKNEQYEDAEENLELELSSNSKYEQKMNEQYEDAEENLELELRSISRDVDEGLVYEYVSTLEQEQLNTSQTEGRVSLEKGTTSKMISEATDLRRNSLSKSFSFDDDSINNSKHEEVEFEKDFEMEGVETGQTASSSALSETDDAQFSESNDLNIPDDDLSVATESEHEHAVLNIDDIRQEEEIVLLEREIKTIKARRAATERQLMLDHKRYKGLKSNIEKTKSRSLQLNQALENHESLANRFKISILKSERMIKRLTEGDGTCEEIAHVAVEDDDDDFSNEVDSKTSTAATSEHELDFLIEHTNLEIAQSEQDDILKEIIDGSNMLRRFDSSFQTKTVELSSLYSYSMMESFARNSDPDRFEGLFLASVKSKRLIMAILALSSREILILDNFDRTARHRRESMWNTCIDVRVLKSNSLSVPTDKANSEPRQPDSENTIDPSIALCQNELTGVCKDPYCSYQHMAQRENGQILPRERIPLSKLALPRHFLRRVSCSQDLPAPEKVSLVSVGSIINNDDFLSLPNTNASHDTVLLEKGSLASVGSVINNDDFLSLPNTNACQDSVLLEKESLVSVGSVINNDDFLSLPHTNASQDSMLQEKVSLVSVGSIINNDDFLWLPQHTNASQDSVSQEKVSLISVGSIINNDNFLSLPHTNASSGMRFEKKMLLRIKKLQLDSFWWTTQTHINLIQNMKVKNAALDMIYVLCSDYTDDAQRFVISQDCLPATMKDGYLFVGMIIDSFRLAINAGRFDATMTLLEVFGIVCNSWDNEPESVNIKEFVSICIHILDVLESEGKRYFSLKPYVDKSPFELTFEIQLSLGLLSLSVERLCSAHINDHSNPTTEWFKIMSLIREMMQESSSHNYSNRELSTILNDAFSKVDQNENKDGTELGLGPLLQDISLGIEISNRVGAIDSCRFLIDELLIPMQSFVAQMLKDAAMKKDNSSNAIMKGTILLSYSVLGALKSVTRSIEKDEDVGKCLIELEEIYTTIDSILVSHRSLTYFIPCVDYLLNPIFAANISLGCSIKRYDKAHGRLESLLLKVMSKNKSSWSPKLPESFMTYTSELLWAQLVQIHMCLPSETKRKESTDMILSSLHLPDDLIQQHEIIASQIVERQIFLRHLQLQNDWNLRSHSRTPEARIAQSCLNIRQILSEEKPMIIEFYLAGKALKLRNSRGLPSLTRHAFPHSLLLCAPLVTNLNLCGCSLRKLPYHFGLYFSNLTLLDISSNELEELPETMCTMIELECLIVSDNNILSIPSNFAPLKLKVFRAKCNQITTLPGGFSSCKHLEVLDLDGNPVDSSFWSVAGSFTKLHELLPSRKSFHCSVSRELHGLDHSSAAESGSNIEVYVDNMDKVGKK